MKPGLSLESQIKQVQLLSGIVRREIQGIVKNFSNDSEKIICIMIFLITHETQPDWECA